MIFESLQWVSFLHPSFFDSTTSGAFLFAPPETTINFPPWDLKSSVARQTSLRHQIRVCLTSTLFVFGFRWAYIISSPFHSIAVLFTVNVWIGELSTPQVDFMEAIWIELLKSKSFTVCPYKVNMACVVGKGTLFVGLTVFRSRITRVRLLLFEDEKVKVRTLNTGTHTHWHHTDTCVLHLYHLMANWQHSNL